MFMNKGPDTVEQTGNGTMIIRGEHMTIRDAMNVGA